MREVPAEGTGVAVSASGTPFATSGADVERYTDDFVSKQFVNPFSLFVGDQSDCESLVLFVGMGATAEVATKTGR
jgi:hypothetical protein